MSEEVVTVRVMRDVDGRIYSEVRKGGVSESGAINAVCIDRQRGKGMDEDTVRRRAKALAGILGLPLIEDTAWRCQAIQARRDCRCPECLEARKNGSLR
jgi:hypothetical protein